MDTNGFSKWLDTLSISSRIAVIALIYSSLTVVTREMFLPPWTAEKKHHERAMEILRGLNELHHTLSNQLLDYAFDKHDGRPIEVLSHTLAEIEIRYRLEGYLEPAIKFAQTRSPAAWGPSKPDAR